MVVLIINCMEQRSAGEQSGNSALFMEPNFHVYRNLLLKPVLSHVNSANMVLLSARLIVCII